MGQYSKKGTYAGYDKNNKEREALDFYATPPEEVENILDALDIKNCNSLLDPGCGGGHMIEGVLNWSTNLYNRGQTRLLININLLELVMDMVKNMIFFPKNIQ